MENNESSQENANKIFQTLMVSKKRHALPVHMMEGKAIKRIHVLLDKARKYTDTYDYHDIQQIVKEEDSKAADKIKQNKKNVF